MIELLLQLAGWVVSPYLKWEAHGEYAYLVIELVCWHILLAVATLGAGGQTICGILAPLKKILSISADSLVDGVLDITLFVPRAVIYAAVVYFRAYVLAARIVLVMLMILVVISFPILALEFLLEKILHLENYKYVNSSLIFLFSLSFGWLYWREDGRSIFLNFKNSLNCLKHGDGEE